MTHRTAYLAVVLAFACGSTTSDTTSPDLRPSPSGGGSLAGTEWILREIRGGPPIGEAEITLVVEDSTGGGNSGCNHYGGAYAFDASTGAIVFRDMGMTAMACAEPARNDFEMLFSQAMGQVNTATIDPAGRLILSGPTGQVVFVLDRQRAVEG